MERYALQGIRVAEFDLYWAGPVTCKLLANMGAQVLKAESMNRIDTVRTMPPWPDLVPGGLNRGGLFNMFNHSKMSFQLNLAHPKGVELAKRLIGISDVLVESFSPRVMKGYGLDYESVVKFRPNIIYLSQSAYGAYGPEKDYAAYGGPQVYLAGVGALTGFPGDAPRLPSGAYSDPIAAVWGAFAVVAALYHRSKTGEGQYIDLAQWETMTSMIPDAIMEYSMNRRQPPMMGNRDAIMAPHGCYRCREERSWVSIAVGSEEEWQALCRAMGNPEWAMAEKFSDAYRRKQNEDELDRLIEEWTVNCTDYEAMEMLQKAGVAAGACLNFRQVAEDAHLNARGFWFMDDHPEHGKPRPMGGVSWKMSETPGKVFRHSPLFGEHNQYVYGELLGLSSEEISALMEEQVIY